ncbi:MAG: LysM domain-containing protein, partial [Chloroflexota bacterium]
MSNSIFIKLGALIKEFVGFRSNAYLLISLVFVPIFFLSGCQPQTAATTPTVESLSPDQVPEQTVSTPIPPRPQYEPGELVSYTVQTGDTVPVLAIHFNTSIEEILAANPIIPADATTLPPGLPMEIPVYYLPFWGTRFQIIPDSLFINGPAQMDFDTSTFVDMHAGWLRDYREYAAGENRTGAQIVDYVAGKFSVSPRLLLALLEYQTGALSQSNIPPGVNQTYPLGYQNRGYRQLYLQLAWAANALNDGYYGWRTGRLTMISHTDDVLERPDPWQNAASVALQDYFAYLYSLDEYAYAVGADGFARVYNDLFGDPWLDVQDHIDGSLQQPEMRLPFEVGKTWAYTGGPHTAWGTGNPWAAIDFAPPSVSQGCGSSSEWNTAVADGIVARSETGIIELDLDGDGDVRTGWVVFYLHLATRDRVPVGTLLKAGDPVGHPSCEGGT